MKFNRLFAGLLSLALLLGLASLGNGDEMAAGEDIDPAIAFLRKLEEKNRETTSLEAEFVQTKIDTGLLLEVKSQGHFWYQAPELFRSSFEAEESEDIWISKGRMTRYVPGLRQVEIIPIPTGDEAPMHQMLLGFGVKVEEILKLFDVSMAERDEDAETIRIRFNSRNLERSMGYTTVHITFSETKMEPRKILLEDEQSQIVIELSQVKVNPEIDASIFEPSWPSGAEVIRYRGGG